MNNDSRLVIAAAALAVWLYLIAARGGFWRASVRDDQDSVAEPRTSPRVVAVVPARNEAEVIAENLGSLLTQDYPGSFAVVLVDDQSSDDTATIAAAVAARAQGRLDWRPYGQPLPAGWAGKLWAMKQGVDHAAALAEPPRYLLFTDADIAFSAGRLRGSWRGRRLKLVLTSLMAKLRCESLAERGLIPAFVFFFQMLYPFAWVNRPDCETAAAAGGCMLVRRDALRRAGGHRGDPRLR